MRVRLRENAPALLFALLGASALAWVGLVGFAWSDYDVEAAPAFGALAAGHLGRFLELAPAYGGSLILRAPFALAPKLWGGGELAVFRMVSLPCLLASVALGVRLVATMRRLGRERLARAAVLGLCVANPITLRALEIGHPEELLAAVLCVAAVLTAERDRPWWTAILLGLAVATKAWAVIAIAPALLVLPRRRAQALCLALAVAAVIVAPLALPQGGALRQANLASTTGTIFQPWQVWWWTGEHGHVVRGGDGQVKAGYRAAPAWISGVPHLLIVGGAVALALLWRRRRGRDADALLLLALLGLLRCALDPLDNVYYSLPFVLALLAWESRARPQPLLTLGATVAVWVSFEELPGRVSADAQAAFYLAWVVPLACGLALRLFAPRLWRRATDRLGSRTGVSLATAARLDG